ncbi:hypothetical protein QYE76_036178 [Lolium multiflorum]|uniref:Uncharacterized protein n=1 Tax=Lolium multiflorum TaxID=4521 RepID=A0AAD8R1X3_LOLMU|nr:hypothetical protein QYE76_036178 [Lolium multiflorum]
MRQLCVSADAAWSRRVSSFSYPVPQVRDSEIDRFDLLLFPLFAALVRRHHPNPSHRRRSAAVLAVGSVVAARESRIVLGIGSGAPAVFRAKRCRLRRPSAPPTTCSVNCAGRFLLLFSAQLCPAIDPHFVPTQMDMWQMLQKYHEEVIDSSSDDESDQSTQTLATTTASMIHEFTSNEGLVHRGSVKGRLKNLPRNRVQGQLRLHKDYFHLIDPLFKEKMFRRRYRMSRELFLVILRGVRDYDPYFQCRPDATGALGFTSYQKCFAAICMLSYGMAADIFDEYLRMGESTCLESMYRFCRAVIAVFGHYYCREPTVEDTRRMLSINESRGFPGMIGSIDCMHCEWKNCPFEW